MAQVLGVEKEEGVVVDHDRRGAVNQVEDKDHQDLEPPEGDRSHNVIHCHLFDLQQFVLEGLWQVHRFFTVQAIYLLNQLLQNFFVFLGNYHLRLHRWMLFRCGAPAITGT